MYVHINEEDMNIEMVVIMDGVMLICLMVVVYLYIYDYLIGGDREFEEEEDGRDMDINEKGDKGDES